MQVEQTLSLRSLTGLDINVDESTNGGDILGPVGSPLLAETLYEAVKLVPSPLEEEAEVDDGWI
jgi:hypothetical protein